MAEFGFVLQFDPGPYPLAPGTELSVLEVVWGLRLGGFNPGTQICDLLSGCLHTVQGRDGRLRLEPPCDRIINYELKRDPEAPG